MSQQTAIIIGAGPAGLTAAYELLKKTNIKPIIYEMTNDIGGLSKTVNYKGNRIDIGGHRFFSKSEAITQWWEDKLPLQGAPAKDDIILKREAILSTKKNAPDPQKTNDVMLSRNRFSRILYLNNFYDYPISLNLNTVTNLGGTRIFKIMLSYLNTRLSPIKNEKTLEDFFINRFGKELYFTFFKDYTEKIWGKSCNEIKPEWGAQRIKTLSITRAVIDACQNILSNNSNLNQQKKETSLIRRFMYPKLGPGQMWEKVAQFIAQNGGSIYLNHEVIGIRNNNNRIHQVIIKNKDTNFLINKHADFFFSTMPVKELIQSFEMNIPQKVSQTARGLIYRDFITVGLLLKKLKLKNDTTIRTINGIIPDNFIYIQEKEVKLGRLQVFNNWSPYLIDDDRNVWVGLEYFCNRGDDLWNTFKNNNTSFAIEELARINVIEEKDVLDAIVIFMPNAYPCYFGTYDQFYIIKNFMDQFENLFLIGRNGMHRYNNQDHSMLTAIRAVDNIIAGIKHKDSIWNTNIESEYHESK